MNPALQRIFSDHGVRMVEETEWLITSGGYPVCRGTVTDPRQSGTGFRVRLDVELGLDDQRTLVESFSDFGATAEEAVRNALFNFCQSSLHVMLSAFWNVHDDAQVLREAWTVHNRQWRATIGNFVRKATNGADVPIPGELFATIGAAIRSHAFSQSAHWVRVYFANVTPSDRITEVLWDGEPWEECATAVRQLAWPALDFFYSCRLFLTLQPVV
ncbi:MAG TPA: DUF6348 family protein [Gemmata sp.]